MEVHAGALLVASPQLTDPNFAGAVVLVLESDEEGALGVVLNRPSSVPVGDVLEAWGETVTEPGVVFVGGPVSPEGALAVGRLADPGDVPIGFREVTGRLGLVDLDTPTELMRDGLIDLRVYAGYAGWGAEQLLAEIDEGAWYVVPGEEQDPFRVDLAAMWREVLRRQPGELAWHSTRPADPRLN